MKTWRISPIIVFLFIARVGAAQETNTLLNPRMLKGKSLEELMEMPVTSVSRKDTRFVEAATAIEVITDEEIRRSGAMSLPDVLRLATGVQVAQADGRTWGITARGFNLTTANKMLVLMDGRSLYTPLFAGVLWDAQDYLIADIDRIEVIRGPGATMWGANAVNGVINIITRSARETQGTYLSTAFGDEMRSYGALRYGDKVGDNTFFRVYAKYIDIDGLALSNGHDARDERQLGQGGFRVDSYPWENNMFTFQGDLYQGANGLPGQDNEDIRGGNLISRWTRRFSDTSELRAQLYYDRVERQFPHTFRERRNTYDGDVQYRFQPHERHDVMVGGNYRWSDDQIGNNPVSPLAFIPSKRDVQVISGFVQDEIALVPERVGLTLGSKFEYNDFSGFEIQPSGRLAYTPTRHQTIWGAISRAVRTPSRIDEDFQVFTVTPTNRNLLIRGDPGFDSEQLVAYELGYRIQPHDRVSFDFATFYNDYDSLRSEEPSRTPTGLPIVLENKLSGSSYGAELGAVYQPLDMWRLHGSFTAFEKHLRRDADSRDPTHGVPEGNDPSYMATLQSSLDLPANFEFDAILRYVDRLPNPHVPSYVALDLRLAWWARKNLEISIVGRNLLDDRHPEFGAASPIRREVERSIYGRITWRF